MASIFPEYYDNNYKEELVLEGTADFKKVIYKPSKNISNEIHGVDQWTWHLFDINSAEDLFTIYPFRNNDDNDFENKYEVLTKISLSDFRIGEVSNHEILLEIISAFPSVLVKNYIHGSGFRKEYHSIPLALEGLNVEHFIISKKQKTSFDEEKRVFTIKLAELDEIRKNLNRITESARSVARHVRRGSAYNGLAFFLKDERYPQRGISVSPNLIARLVDQTASKLVKQESKAAIETIKRNSAKIVKEEPDEIIKLRNDLDLVTLDQLILKFREKMGQTLNENKWQSFFNDNPFILNMAFGYPIIKVHDQTSVGGRKLSGDGDKIVDFLVKNSISNNAALFEIKKPSTKLLNKTKYRDGIYPPSTELVGAVTQVLDQKQKFEQTIPLIKNNSRINELESYAVHGILIIGQSLTDVDEQKSFEMFRGNSKSVAVITFDEVLGKLEQLHAFLSPAATK